MRMERLIAAQRDLTNGISHELRTPLARVRFALEMLREPGSAAEYGRAREHRAGRDQLEELIDMSLTYARLEYSSLQSNLEMTAPSRGSSIRSAMRSCCIRSARSSRASRSRRTCA